MRSLYETTPLQCILCGPNSSPNKCSLNMFSGISSAGHMSIGINLALVMPPTLKKLMGHIAFGACVRGWVRAWVGVSHFLYLL